MSCTYDSMNLKSKYTLISTVKLVFLKVSRQYTSCFQTAVVHKYCIQGCMHSIFCKTENYCTKSIPAEMADAGRGSKVIPTDSYHFSHLLPLEFPLSPVCACARVCLCYVYQTVCVSACVHGFPRGSKSTYVHVCVVCFNASATCGNLKLWGWNRLPRWGLFSVVPSFSAFFFLPPSASDSSNKLSRLGYSPQYKAVFPFFCSLPCSVFTFFS